MTLVGEVNGCSGCRVITDDMRLNTRQIAEVEAKGFWFLPNGCTYSWPGGNVPLYNDFLLCDTHQAQAEAEWT